MSNDVPRDMYTIPELAHRLNLSESKVYEMAQEGTFPLPLIRFGKSVRVSARAYEVWISQFDYKEGGEDEAETDVCL